MKTINHRDIATAVAAVRRAQQQVFNMLQALFPMGTPVRVKHHRGSFDAVVCGHRGQHGHGMGELVVRNLSTTKAKQRGRKTNGRR